MAAEEKLAGDPASHGDRPGRSRLYLHLSGTERVRILVFVVLTVGWDTFLYYRLGVRLGSARDIVTWLLSPLQVGLLVWLDTFFQQGMASQVMMALAAGGCFLGSWILDRDLIVSIICAVWFARETSSLFAMLSRKSRKK